MRRSLALLIVFGLAFVTKAQEGTIPHPGNIQGTWKIVQGQDEGKRVPEARFRDDTVVITDKTIRITDKDNKQVWLMTYQLNPRTTPPAITMTVTQGEGAGQTAEASISSTATPSRSVTPGPASPGPRPSTPGAAIWNYS